MSKTDFEGRVLVAEALGRENRCYVYGRPELRATPADTLAWWRESAEAEILARGLDPKSTRVVWAISMLDVESLAVPAPPGTPGVSRTATADGKMLPITWLRYLVDNGVLFEWSATAIRRAREDFGPAFGDQA